MFFSHLFKKNNKSDQYSSKMVKQQTYANSATISSNPYSIQIISRGQFPVYLVSSKVTNQQDVVMKAFPYDGYQPHPYYRNEARFMQLRHPNVIQFLHTQDHKGNFDIGSTDMFSYILMEYAPNGDFREFIRNYGAFINEKLARTYFRQLIEGLEYLHANRVVHLDLKPENLFIGSGFTLKIGDFDLSYVLGDQTILSKGTKSFRAPEIFRSTTQEPHLRLPFAADIYSAGILLFVLISGGTYAYHEDKLMKGFDMLTLMNNNNEVFWKKHCDIQQKSYSYFSKSFIELFNGMTRPNPEQRLTIQQIKQSKWYNGPVYSHSKLEKKMTKILKKKQEDEWAF